MTNVTKRKIYSEDYKIAYKEMLSLITKLTSKTAPFLIEDLLTDSERVMLVKRFAAAFMCKHGHSPYRISQTTGLSVSTAQRIYNQYENGDYDRLLGCLKKREQNRFLSLLEDIIMAQVSPRARARLLNRSLSK